MGAWVCPLWEEHLEPPVRQGEPRCPACRAAAVVGLVWLGSADAGLMQAVGRGGFYTMYVQMQRIKGNGSDSSGLSSWGTRSVGTCVFAPCCTNGDQLPLCCHRPQTLCCCLHLRCLSLAGVLPGGWSPGRRFGTCGGHALSAHRRRKRASSCWPDLAPGWDPPARPVPAKGWLCQDAALLPAAPLPASQGGGEGDGGAGLAVPAPMGWGPALGLPWMLWALRGCRGPCRPQRGEQGRSLPSPSRLPAAQPLGQAGLCRHWGCLPSPAPLMELGCDGAKHQEQPQSPSPSRWRAWLCREHRPGSPRW